MRTNRIETTSSRGGLLQIGSRSVSARKEPFTFASFGLRSISDQSENASVNSSLKGAKVSLCTAVTLEISPIDHGSKCFYARIALLYYHVPASQLTYDN